MIVSIVIPTYQRPTLLAKAVASCLNQNNVDPNEYEIVVVDNCPDKSSRSVVFELMAQAPAITYVSEPKRGVVFARNTGITAARGEYVAFLDDDECATSNWLNQMLKHGLLGSVAVFGPIREIVPDSLRKRRNSLNFSIVSRFIDRPDGADISDCLFDLGTGNSLFNKVQCFGEQNRFDERHNFGGGEDIEFLSRLRDKTIRLTWAANAWVEESVSAERLTTRYLMKRRFHAGQVRAIVGSRNSRLGFVQVAFWMAVGGVQIIFYSAGWLIAYLLRRDQANYAARIAGGAGKLLFFYRSDA